MREIRAIPIANWNWNTKVRDTDSTYNKDDITYEIFTNVKFIQLSYT